MHSQLVSLAAFLLPSIVGAGPIVKGHWPGPPFLNQTVTIAPRTIDFAGDPNLDRYCVYGARPSADGYADAQWIEVYAKRWEPKVNKITNQCADDFRQELEYQCNVDVMNFACVETENAQGDHGVKIQFHFRKTQWPNQDNRRGSIERAFRYTSTYNAAHDTAALRCTKLPDA
ncbi:hypothetical protein M406DRAFT_71514 [Cryphonectria parasitica EP155]|uniref:Uncharacterized protein n=1 Tax=Cryphonectria parasitica (strain ATCC 38755 / EP155) TaxID=660469 RepID=A0A9P4Y8K7_CRYP1|nr:uncharacterized protein M406DRAFT_71514 [Cryphonectria parasitica EP155]KAF3768518.1 hypothetical protein M406DRAFT_71514 [Cryphonectria parasitica EP155]